jgi:pimeloyl-ACP methyl ester carboxylesterase
LAYDPAIAELLQQANDKPAIDLWPLFKQLSHTPMLLLRGELSDIISRHSVGKMQAQKPNMQFIEIANCGHAPLLSEPNAVNATDQFLSALKTA